MLQLALHTGHTAVQCDLPNLAAGRQAGSAPQLSHHITSHHTDALCTAPGCTAWYCSTPWCSTHCTTACCQIRHMLACMGTMQAAACMHARMHMHMHMHATCHRLINLLPISVNQPKTLCSIHEHAGVSVCATQEASLQPPVSLNGTPGDESKGEYQALKACSLCSHMIASCCLLGNACTHTPASTTASSTQIPACSRVGTTNECRGGDSAHCPLSYTTPAGSKLLAPPKAPALALAAGLANQSKAKVTQAAASLPAAATLSLDEGDELRGVCV
jgi:hypothetical protein